MQTNHIKECLLMESKENQLFQISLVNKQNRPLIRPCNSFSQLLTYQDRDLNKLLNFTQPLPKTDRIFPLVWIDCSLDNTTTGSSASSQTSISFKTIFQQILSQSINPTQNDKNTQANNHKMLITSKFIKAQQQNQTPKKNIQLIHLTLFLNINQLSDINKNLISLCSFLARDVIVNCTQIDKNNENTLTSLLQIFQLVSQNKKQQGNKLIGHKRVHFLGMNLKNESLFKGRNDFIFYRIKDQANQTKVCRSLSKLKQRYLQGLDMIYGNQEGFTMKEFLKKYEIASRILENQQKHSLHLTEHLFNAQRISKASQQLSRKCRYTEDRIIREKLQNFYCSLTDTKKSQLPLPQALIKFKIEQMIRSELKEISDQGLLQKLSAEYEKKIMEINEKEVEKILVASMGQYLSSIFSQSMPINKERQILCLRPEKVTFEIQDFIQTMQSTHIFISQTQINKYIRSQMHLNFYKKLYDEYVRVKRSISGNQIQNQELIEKLKRQLEKLKKQTNELEKDNELKNYSRKSFQNRIQNYKKELKTLRDQLILLKAKDQTQIYSTKHSAKKITQNTHWQKLKFSILQQIINDSGKESQKLTKCLQNQLNAFKNEFTRLQSELLQKSKLIDQKEQTFKDRIFELENQLISLKVNSNEILQLKLQKQLWRENTRKQIESLYQKKLQSAKNEFNQKVESYKHHINQFQQAKNLKNQQIQSLNSLLYAREKSLSSLEGRVQEAHRKSASQDKNTTELLRLLEDANVQLNAKTQQILQLTQKIKQKNIKIEILEQDLSDIQASIKNHELNHQSQKYSFLKFQKDLIKPQSELKSSPLNSSQVKINSQETPQKRTSRIKTASEINENLQLQKLIHERRTIEKKKERFNHQESLLHKMQSKLMGPNSQIKVNHHGHQLKMSTKIMAQHTEQAQRALKQSNRMLLGKIMTNNQVNSQNLSSECRRKLF